MFLLRSRLVSLAVERGGISAKVKTGSDKASLNHSSCFASSSIERPTGSTAFSVRGNSSSFDILPPPAEEKQVAALFPHALDLHDLYIHIDIVQHSEVSDP